MIKCCSMLMFSALMLSGCFFWTSRNEGDELKSINEAQSARLETLEKSLKSEIEARKEAEVRVAKLNETLENLGRHGSDLLSRVDQLEEKSSTIAGSVAEQREIFERFSKTLTAEQAELRERASMLSKTPAVDASATTPKIPAEKRAHFAAAQDALNAGNDVVARHLFREYIQRYPTDPQTPEAQYKLGQSFLGAGKPATALGEFQLVITKYSTSDMMDDTLLGMGQAFFKLGACTDAKQTLRAIIKDYPRSNLIPQAKTLLQEIAKAPKASCTS